MKIRDFIKQSLNKLIQLSLKTENPSLRSKIFENKFKILIYFTQLLSVLLTDKSRNDDENFILRMAKFITMQYINQVEHCTLALVSIVLIHLIIFAIVIFLNQIKNSIIIEVVRIYFSIYDWIIFIPSQMLCFVTNDIRITIFSFTAMIVSSLQFFFSIYLFRDSGFNQSNGRSKKISFDLLYLLTFEAIILLQYIQPEMHAVLKYFLLYFLIIIKMFEFQTTCKFFEKSTLGFYYTACIVVFIITVQCMLVELFGFQPDPYFYTLLLILPLLNIFQTLENRDIFDVEYFYYTIKQIDNPEAQIQGHQLIIGHRSQCFISDCLCRKVVTFNTQHLNKFVTQVIKREKKFNYLKYLSFQIQNNNNGFRNYLQIMKVMNRNIEFTRYDKLVIKALLSHVREKTKLFYKEIIKSKFQEVIFSLQWFEENRGVIQGQLDKLLSLKLNLWTSYVIDKIETYQQLYDLQISISREIENVKQILLNFKNQISLSLTHSITLEKNLFYQRICQIVELSSLSVNKYGQYEKKIQKIIFQESGQGELLNYLMFENQQAMQLLIIISKEQRGKIEKISNQWNLLSNCQNLGDLMPEQFIEVHNALLDNYCKIGPSKNQIFETFIKFGDTPLISRIKICINNFPRYDNDFLYLMGTLIKPSNQEEIDFILVDSNFQVLGYSETLQQKIFYNNAFSEKFMKLNLFQLIPESKIKLTEYYEQMQKLNLSFHNHEKIICYKQLTKLLIGTNFEQVPFVKQEYKMPLSPYERLHTIENISDDKIGHQAEFQFDIILTISEVCISYSQHEEQKKFIYYWVNFNFQDEKIFEKQVFQQYSFEIQKKKNDDGARKIEFSHIKINESIAQTTSSLQQNSSHIFQFHQILTLINRITAYKLLLMISVFFFLFYVIAFILIFFQIQKKEIQQTQCFDQLGYSTEFLDKYGRIMIASRHVIYRRDYNKFLNQYNLYHIDEGANINVTSVDKISFSLYIYKQSILELISFFEDEQDKLKIYYEQDQTVDLIRINYYANATELQTIGSLAEYFQVMIQTFFMAIKTFAKDPTLYLKGTTDTYAQVNTRSILYFNFKRVSNITLNFMETCQQNDQVINALLDSNFNTLLSVSYALIGFQILLFIFVYKLIQKKRKFVLSLFTRTSLEEGVEEIQILSKLSDIVKNSKIWFGIYEELEENQNRNVKQYFGKSIKSHIKSSLSSKVLWKFLIPLCVISYVSLLINHSYYIDYSSNLSPIVTAALKTLYIRLLFLNVINNWDVYVTREFYNAMISIQSTATGSYKLYTENIRHGYQLYLLSGVDDDLLKSNLKTLQQEPYTDLVYSQSSTVNSSSLLGQDICIILDCDMKADVYSDRVYANEMDSTYKVGIINLFKSTIQVINSNDFFSLTDPYDIIAAFEKLEKSKEYFTYFLWGFDATLYQNRLFSNYFINLSKHYLEQLTSQLKYLYFSFAFGSSFLVLLMLILGNWMIQQEFVQTIEILYQIPRQTIVNKQLGRQLRLL